MDNGLTPQNLLRVLPDVLRNDSNMNALATAIADTLSRRTEEIPKLMIYPQIDALPEGLLDILSFDFKVDWWDADYTQVEKRRTLKESWRVHRTLGTKGAVQAAISAIYPDARVSEWFDYGGEPYHFKLLIQVTNEEIDLEKHKRAMEKVNYYKNLRSVLDEVVTISALAPDLLTAVVGMGRGYMETPMREAAVAFHLDETARGGGIFGTILTTAIPVAG